MGTDAALELADSLVFAATGKHLSDLQRRILQAVWQRKTYAEIARRVRYTEGHVKDTASLIWQALSQALAERVTKTNSLSVLERYRRQSAVLSPQESSPEGFCQGAALEVVGREAAIAHLNNLVAQGHRAIVLQGEGGIGKTTLAQAYLTHHGPQPPLDKVLELLMAKETVNVTPVEQVVEEWLRQDFQTEPGQAFGVTLDRLKRHLREYRVGVLIDNLEPALDGQGRFWPHHARYADLLRVLTDSQGHTLTLLTSRDRLCEPGVSVTHYRLPGLEVETWQTFFSRQGIVISPATLTALHRVYGGNAKAMTLLRGSIHDDFEGDGEAYWQAWGADPLTVLDLKNLVATQVTRVRSLDLSAYQLLCRLSVFRYQDVPRVPLAGLLALMWDSEPAHHRQIIASLRNRSLLESQKGEYWLHPVVQAEAWEHLRSSPDWVLAHTHAAQFWTDHVAQVLTLTDAIYAFEGYHPAIAIADYDRAAAILLKSRPNQWGQHLTLGSTLYRLGLLQPLMTAIPALLPHLPEDQRTSELRNILADASWMAGKIHSAIALQRQAHEIAQRGLLAAQTAGADAHEIYYWRMLDVDALLSLGLYYLDLWELDTAAELFQRVMSTAEGTPHQSWADKAKLCLALVLSCPRSASAEEEPAARQRAIALADQAYAAIAQAQTSVQMGRYAFFLQLLAQTYRQLGQHDRATDLYERAIAAVADSHYTPVQAKSLMGLGSLLRQAGDNAAALQNIHTALSLLEDLGARGDLAEAHYQLGLTYQTEGRTAIAQTHFATAQQYFEAIPAPRQVVKVQASDNLPVPAKSNRGDESPTLQDHP